MNRYLPAIALSAAAVCHAQPPAAAPTQHAPSAVDAAPRVADHSQLSKTQPAPDSATRQLTPEQKSELRRQLYQFRRSGASKT